MPHKRCPQSRKSLRASGHSPPFVRQPVPADVSISKPCTSPATGDQTPKEKAKIILSERHRILIVDDSAQDRQAVVDALRRAAETDGVEVDALEVDTVGAARVALQHEEFSCVFLDHDLPDGTALDLLIEVRAQGLITPVVVLTGQRDEQTVAEVMRAGAVDYLPKERLHPDFVARSLRAALLFHQAQRDKQAALDELRARDRAIAAAPSGIVIADPRQPDCPLVYVNEAFTHMTGYTEEEALGRNCRFLQGPGTDPDAVMELRAAVREERGCQVLILNCRKDGTTFWNEVTVSPVWDARGNLTHFVGVQADITARFEADAQQRSHTEREALVSRVRQVLLATTDPNIIQGRAAALLGEALGADRCYMSTWDATGDRILVHQDHRRADLPSVAGEYRASQYAPIMDALFAHGTAVVPDVRFSGLPGAVVEMMTGLALNCVLAVPFFGGDGRITAALMVAMADGPRVWTPEEVSLAETVAVLTRTAVEAARLQEREHRIAEQLQDALQPASPEHVPGLSIGKFTQPALAEAEIGGDFFDIFPLDKELYAVVIGDVSGKGLAAAQQLALIRNSLRTTLYLYRAPAQAAAAVNAIVTAHNLLVGFVTAWVGVYDATTGQITYCSCGHEPGLIWRADEAVEALETTGPPLGVAENAKYSELNFTLSSGDALLLYTDGISEAGLSRRAMLGTEGLMRFLGALPGQLAVQAATDALVAEVSAFAGGAFRDDVAVLLVRRE